MNANIFSCTVPPLLVLETQIIHHELLQSLCTNPCVPLGSIFLAHVCARPLASARALRQRGSRFDTSASLKLPTVEKKNMVRKFLHA